MPTPYDYTVPQPNVGSYFDAMRQGRADRLTAENDQKMSALAKYLPGALQGNEVDRSMALEAAPVDQMANLKQTFMTKNAQELEALRQNQGRAAALAQWADTPEKWAVANAEMKKSMPGSPDIPFEQRGMVIAKAQTVADQLEQAYKEKMLANDTSRTTAQNAASYAQAEAARALASQRGDGGKPLPTRIQTAEDDDIQAIQTTQSIGTQIDVVLDQLKNGELELGPINNALGGAQNYLGLSTPNSRNLAMFQATLEKLRNDSLRLNKGVQTEGDAVRAWNEVARSINDPQVVAVQLMRVKRLNEIAAKQRQQAINVRRARNGADPFDFNTIDVAAPTGQTPPAPPRAAVPAQGRGPAPGTVEGGFEFQGGDPADPNNWEPVQ